ncbi:MAG: DUF4829 domain-containing protein [Romboutsia sp.]
MNNNKKKLLLIIIFSLGLLGGCKIKSEDTNEYISTKINKIIEETNIKELSAEAEQIIKNSFLYSNQHDLDKVLQCYVDRYKDFNFGLNNLEYMEMKCLTLITDELRYRQYINNIFLNEQNLEIKEIKIYEVKYDIEYKNDSIEPTDSGETTKEYILIKIKDSNNWLIHSIGTM